MSPSRMVANDMGDECVSPSVVLRSPCAPSVVAENLLCSLYKSLLSGWKFYPTFLTLLLCFPIMQMAYTLLTLMLILLPPAPLHLLTTRRDLFCVCLLKAQCLKLARLMCVYPRPQNIYSGVEMSGGNIRWLSGHLMFSDCLVFVDLHCTTHRCQWCPIEIMWPKYVGLWWNFWRHIWPVEDITCEFFLWDQTIPQIHWKVICDPAKNRFKMSFGILCCFFRHIFPVHLCRYQFPSHFIWFDCLRLLFL